MTIKVIFLNDGVKENKLLNELFIINVPDSLTFIGLELYGQTYFKLERKEIEECYKNATNLIEYWGFSQPIPIQGKLIIKYDDNCSNIDIFSINYIKDSFGIWNKVLKGQEDFSFYDKRIEKNNFLRCKHGCYGIVYNL